MFDFVNTGSNDSSCGCEAVPRLKIELKYISELLTSSRKIYELRGVW